jgi:hypothetical protein
MRYLINRWNTLDDEQKVHWLFMPPATIFSLPLAYGIWDVMSHPQNIQDSFLRWVGNQWWTLPAMVVLLIPILAALFYLFKIERNKFRAQRLLERQLDLWERFGYEVAPPPRWVRVGIIVVAILSAVVVWMTFDPTPVRWLANLLS